MPAADLAVVPDGLDLIAASTVPLNGLAAAQIVDLLGDAPTDGNRLLVTGAAGAVGGYVASLAQDRGWQVTGLARTEDEDFVRGLGADFTTHAEPGWDAVADGAALQERGLALVRDGGAFVGVQPGAEPATQRGITVVAVVAHPDGPRLADLLARTASRPAAGPSARGRSAGPGRRRPPGRGQGRGARSLRAQALTTGRSPGSVYLA